MRNRFFNVTIVAAALCAMAALPAQSASAMSMPAIGVGPHGYDFLVGTWTCKNSTPSAMSGPAVVNLSVGKTADGVLNFHASGASFHAMGYVTYMAKTKMWANPSAASDGSYGTETSAGTGRKNTWTGPFTSGGKTMQQRDTYTWLNATTYNDLYQIEMGGSWKTEGNSTCSKS